MTAPTVEIIDRAADLVGRVTDPARTAWLGLRIAGAAVDQALADPLGCYAAAARADRFFFEQGESGDLAVGLGVVDEIESAGAARFSDVRAWTRDVGARIHWDEAARATTSPTFFGGFGFEDEARGTEDWKAFPAARFVLPRLILSRRGDVASASVLVRVEPGASAQVIDEEIERAASWFASLLVAPVETSSAPIDLDAVWADGPEFRVQADRPHAVYCAQVERALGAIDEGDLEKVVLARSLSVRHDGVIDVPSFLARLRSLYPTCTLVAMGRGDDTFLAATPELLVRAEAGRVSTAALAGSAPRGRHPDEDRAFGEGLLASTKERAEHAHVVDAIRRVLAPRTETLEVASDPGLRRLFGIQHLETPIEGTLMPEHADVLELVEALHPTPAVGGVPGPAAEAWLRRAEGLDRGWYAAPIGFLDAEGGGDFRVALRSALIRNAAGDGGSRSLLFAGAGLVEGSVPEEELAETRIKLRALLAPLTEI